MARETITLTAERIREAAKTCPEAARVLKVLAPEAFEGDDQTVPEVYPPGTRIFPFEHPMCGVIRTCRMDRDTIERGLYLAHGKGYAFSLENKGHWSFLRVTRTGEGSS